MRFVDARITSQGIIDRNVANDDCDLSRLIAAM